LQGFGYSKKLNPGETKTHSIKYSNYHFPAPEQFTNKPNKEKPEYDKNIDFWSLGILTFVMLYNKFPFEGSCKFKVEKMIANSKKTLFSIPDVKVADEIKDFIIRLCEFYAQNRLGAGVDGSFDLKRHCLFSKIDWNELILQSRGSPILNLLKKRI